MATAIVIGLGTTGLNIVEELQQFHYQFTGENKSNKVEYIYCETNISAQSQGTAKGNSSIISVPISLTDMAARIPALKNQPITNDWIPDANIALADGKGAGGQSAYGRLALWMNWNNVQSAITNAWQKVQGDSNTYIFIVGTLTGGTCSGAFIDMAYLARSITNSSKVFGLFLVPGKGHIGVPGGNTILENYLIATTAIKELSKSDGSIVYDYTWPGGSKFSTSSSPYNQVYYLSSDYVTNAASLQSISQLSKVAGLHLCTRIIDFDKIDGNGLPINDFSSLIDARMIDIKQNLQGYEFSTFGTTLIHYPKSQLIEYTGLDICQELLSSWIDPTSYSDRVGTKQDILGNKNRINGIFNQEFENRLLKSLNIVDGRPTTGAETMQKAIENDVDKIIKDGNLNTIAFKCFTSNDSNNHFSFISNNAKLIQDSLVNEIFDLIEEFMQQYQNLNIVKNSVISLSDYINEILGYWNKTYKIDGNPANFNRILQTAIVSIGKNAALPKSLLQNKAYLQEQFTNLLMLTKLHVGVSILQNVKTALVANQADNYILRSDLHTLPSIQSIDTIILRVIESIKKPAGRIGRDITNRKIELEQEMSSTAHFIAIYNQDRNSDINDIRNKYNNIPAANKFTYSDLTGGKKIFTYLIGSIQGNSEKIYEDCIQQSVNYVRQKQLVGNNGIAGLIANLSQRVPQDPQWVNIQDFFLQTSPNIVPSKIPGLIGLKQNVAFQPHRCLHLIYISSNIQTLQNPFSNSQSYLNTLNPQQQTNSVNLSSLNEALVVFQEYGFTVQGTAFDPVNDIAINSPIKLHVLKIPKASLISRCPYLDAKKLQSIINTIQ